MATRNQIRGVADGTLTAFVSRNNDVDGYWGIGKLCRFALEAPVSDVEVDLVHSRMVPDTAQFESMIAKYRSRLLKHLRSLNLAVSSVAEAKITVAFERARAHQAHVSGAPGTLAFRCQATIVDALGRTFDRRHDGGCWPHDPSRESRSALPDRP